MTKKTAWILVNAGSSSLKLALYQPTGEKIADWQVERLGGDSRLHRDGVSETFAAATPAEALAQLFPQLTLALGEAFVLTAAVHRVVQGGRQFTQPVLLNPFIIEALEKLSPLAPLHNPLALACIEMLTTLAPELPQVAVFDSAFHHALPEVAYTYALPDFCRSLGIRRYGFHGLSLTAVSAAAATFLHKPLSHLNLIIAHLGNGASVTALRGGQSVDHSMGFTPLAGLVMGSRAGDLDPAIPDFLARQAQLSPEAIDKMLYQDSGLTGLCGYSDLRDIHAAIADAKHPQQAAATLALQVFIHRLRHYLGAYLFQLGQVDALIFTGGIGEHDATVRALALDAAEPFGIFLDRQKNQQLDPKKLPQALQRQGSPTAILVIHSDEAQAMLTLAKGLLLENTAA